MNIDVQFEEQNMALDVDFGEVQTAQPGGSPSKDAEERLQKQIGDLAELSTENKENLVAAINEVASKPDGLSAYEIAVKNGFEGTEQEWLASLKGEPGKDGQPGKDGKDGVDGGGIVNESFGSVVALTDSTDRNLHGLNIYGKTTQDGTPTQESPVELVTSGANGAINTFVTGKNLFGGDIFADKLVEVAGATKDEASRTVTFKAENVNKKVILSGAFKANTQYTLILYGMNTSSEKSFANIGFNYTDGSKSDPLKFKAVNELSYCVHTSEKGKTISCVVGVYNTKDSIIQYDMCGVFEGVLTEADFEPHVSQILPISTPNGLFGVPAANISAYPGNYTDENGQQWICDEIDFVRGVYIQRTKTVDMGSLNWRYSTGTYPYFYTEVSKKTRSQAGALCTAYSFEPEYTTWQNGDLVFNDRPIKNHGMVNFVNHAYTDAADFKAAMSGQTILVALETPVETPLSADELSAFAELHTNYPTTAIYNDEGAGLGVKYVADTKLYIDNKFTELRNAILSAGANV